MAFFFFFQVMLHSELLRSGEYVVWVCLMGLVMPQTVLCQAELTDLWSLVCRNNMIIPVSGHVVPKSFFSSFFKAYW